MQLMQAGFQRGSAAEVATAAASAGSFKDLVAVVPDFRAQIRVTSVATCKIVPVPGVAPTMDELFWRELQYTSVKKEGHFKAAAFTTGGAGEEWGVGLGGGNNWWIGPATARLHAPVAPHWLPAPPAKPPRPSQPHPPT